jgi:hypothetical protein
MSDTLYVFAVTAKTEVRHTHLTRASREVADLPPLTDWLGAEVDTGEVELFPIRDLGDMTLSDYITMAFAPEAIAPQTLRKINGIKGSVLLVPERALSEEPAPGKEATLIASLPLAGADHAASLPKADVTPPPRPAPPPTPEPRRRGAVVWVIGGVFLLVLVLAVLVG